MEHLVRKRRALTSLLPLVDGYWDRAELLNAKGWYSFQPYWSFRQSLCSSVEWQFFKNYLVEDTKEALGEYRSALLDELRAKCSGGELFRCVACARNYEDLRKTPDYRAAWKPYRDEQMRLRQREIEFHATRISRLRPEDDEQVRRIRIWSEVVREMAEPLGFETSSSMSGRYSPNFRRPLTSKWNLVLGVDVRSLGYETADKIAKPPGMDPLPIGVSTTWKAIAPAGKSKLHPTDRDLVFVPQYFFPYEHAYGNFWDLEGLEINVRADMTALQLIWPELEVKLVEGVSALM